jgi:hypothetical protein
MSKLQTFAKLLNHTHITGGKTNSEADASQILEGTGHLSLKFFLEKTHLDSLKQHPISDRGRSGRHKHINNSEESNDSS